MVSHEDVLEVLKELNSSNAQTRNAIKLSATFRDKKCRLRLENTTRWSSAFLMLESVKRAYDRGAFNEEIVCPVDQQTIELYIQVLKPAYLLSISFQLASSSIAETVPGK